MSTSPPEGAQVDERTVALDRAHVFHSWSAQGALNPMPIAGGSGAWVWNHAGRRFLDLSSQLVNTNIGHQHPAVVAAITEQAQLLTTIAPSTANLTRGLAAEAIVRHAPGGLRQGVLHQRRRRRERERDPDGPAAHRPGQGDLDLPLVPRQHRRGRGRDGRLAARAQRVRPRSRARVRAVPVPLGVLGDHAGGGVGPRAAPPRARGPGRGAGVGRRDPARDGARHRRRARPAARLPGRRARRSRTGTASC